MTAVRGHFIFRTTTRRRYGLAAVTACRRYGLPPFLFLICSLLCLNAQAANWYVRSGAGGSGTGVDWTNAWISLSGINWSSVACGDTIWIAGGTYTSALAPNKVCTAGSPVTINRVLATDTVPVSAAGWNAAFASLVTINGLGINFSNNNSYLTIDGRVNYGILINMSSGGGDGIAMAQNRTLDNLIFRHIEVFGPACALTQNCSTAAYGINLSQTGGAVTNTLFNNVYVHRIGEGFRAFGWNNVTVEYSAVSDMHNDGVDHEDVIYSYSASNVTWRYNKIWNSPNDGVFHEFGGQSNWKFYGNVFYGSTFAFITFKGPGTYGPISIFNNSFVAPSASNWGQLNLVNLGGALASGSEVSNNIFFYVSNGAGTSMSHNNAYNYTTLNGFGWPSGESGSFTFTGTPFVNPTAGDFHLTSAGAAILANKGKVLTADGFINKDMDGNTRGADGAWDIGAFEFSTGAPPPPPPPPSGSACDVNKDNTTNIVDVQQCVNQSLGIAACTADINKDGICNVVDVQRVVNAALGGQCVTQ